MPLAEFSDSLNEVPYGACVMDLDRTILFWNRSAERITGHRASRVVGRQCYEVLYGLSAQPSALSCKDGCFTHRLKRTGRLAPAARIRMRYASGRSKRVVLTVLLVPGAAAEPVLVHLFHDQVANPRPGLQANRGDRGTGPLTPREREMVELLAGGYDTRAIAEHLHLSEHTVRNYVRNAREKLHAPSKLALVLTAQRLGLL